MADTQQYSCNAEDVLQRVKVYIAQIERKKAESRERYGGRYREKICLKMNDVYSPLSIFDWWKDTLSLKNLTDMRMFLETAIKMGYKGYVCFKVGVPGCSHGMWAHKNQSTNGYSPDGEVLFRSFRPDFVEWDAELPDGSWVHDHIPTAERQGAGNNITLKQVKGVLSMYGK